MSIKNAKFLLAIIIASLLVVAGCGAGVKGGTTTTGGTTGTGSGGGNSAPTVSISVSPSTMNAGQLGTLTWSSTNATSVTITPKPEIEDVNTLPLSGSVAITPSQTTTYQITANGGPGTTPATASATVTVNQVAPVVQFQASPTTINGGQSSTLSWTATNATSFTIDNGIGAVNAQTGSVIVTPAVTTTYTATATGPGGTTTVPVTVTVSGLNIVMTASPQSVQPGQSSTISFTSQNAVSISVDNGVGALTPPNGTFVVSPTTTTTYTATATDASNNTRQAKVTVFVGGDIHNIKHIIFLVQENRSFDSYFGKLGLYKAAHGYSNDIDGVPDDTAVTLKDLNGAPTHPYHYKTTCTENLSPAWNESHYDADFNSSSNTYLMDNFMQTTTSVPHQYDPAGHRAMGYYTDADLPYYYELATQFATSDRFFSPLLANTVPNRMYLFAATSFGTTYPENPAPGAYNQPTIFDKLTAGGVSWRYYYQDNSVFLQQYSSWPQLQGNVYPISDYYATLQGPNADNMLPQVIFIERGSGQAATDEHPDADVQIGAAAAKQMIDALMASPVWQDSVFILTYDEGGGLYDHVAPQPMPTPDDQQPQTTGEPFTVTPGQFNTTGFRLPIIVVSPWVKPHYTSHVVRDSTAILKFIETRFGLTPLTRRDAAQDDMTEFFDFSNPAFITPPPLPAQPAQPLSSACSVSQVSLEAQP